MGKMGARGLQRVKNDPVPKAIENPGAEQDCDQKTKSRKGQSKREGGENVKRLKNSDMPKWKQGTNASWGKGF